MYGRSRLMVCVAGVGRKIPAARPLVRTKNTFNWCYKLPLI
jgi:hypothetical protein